MKIKYKGYSLTHRKVVNNILRMYDKSSKEDRKEWYNDANNFAYFTCIHGVRFNGVKEDKMLIPKFMGIIAAMSPLKNWDENKKIAEHFLLTGKVKHTKAVAQKVKKIMESKGDDCSILDLLNGDKTSSFYMNIKHPESRFHVTIDRHAVSIAMGFRFPKKANISMTPNQYTFFTECYQIAAEERNVIPTLIQSATWVYFRNNKEILKQKRK